MLVPDAHLNRYWSVSVSRLAKTLKAIVNTISVAICIMWCFAVVFSSSPILMKVINLTGGITILYVVYRINISAIKFAERKIRDDANGNS